MFANNGKNYIFLCMFPENPKGLLFTAKYGRVCGRFVTRVKKKATDKQTDRQTDILVCIFIRDYQ